MKNILFISHDAYRSGAQIFLLELLKYLKDHSSFEFEVLLKENGELLAEFENIAPTYIWNKAIIHKNLLKRYYNFKEKIRKRKIFNHIRNQNFDLIYANTIANGNLLNELSYLKIPVIIHVHELNYWITRYGQQNFEFVLKYANKYIAVSEAVKNNLIEKFKIPIAKIHLINEFTNFDKITKYQEKGGIRKLLNLSNDCLIIGACGTELWRKGKDLFIPLAIQTLKTTEKEVHFVWIGGQVNYELQFDLEKSGFEDKIHFINHLSEASRYFNDFDIFLMLSREDPFPIVNLEVAALAKPILCFSNSGGTPELLSLIKECVSDYLNLEEMSNNIKYLINNAEHRIEIGKLLEGKVKNQFNIDIIASKIATLIDQI